ncbi:MAG: hypothetical protein SOW78_06425 [Clostridia bacterium]|nr:hypothetical protein [Clostridia bacterium]
MKKMFVRLAAGAVSFLLIILTVLSAVSFVAEEPSGEIYFNLAEKTGGIIDFVNSFTAEPMCQHARFVSGDAYISSEDQSIFAKFYVIFFVYTVILVIMYSVALRIKDKLSRCSFRMLI